MTRLTNETIFEHLGIDQVINGCGIYTDLGGSMLSPDVWNAMTNRHAQKLANKPQNILP
tara:strand:- start:418 stop:594 length:177 start_codon:yes stop_codon:yes gene_type:complete